MLSRCSRFRSMTTTASVSPIIRGCIDLSIPGVPLIPILYEDDDILVVNKPSPMLSVPGRSEIPRLPRHMEWRKAINYAADNEQLIMTPECRDHLRVLSLRSAKADNIPRKKEPFENCARKMLKIIDNPGLITELWEAINKSDEMQHKVSVSDVPPHRISAVEAAEYYCNNLSPLAPPRDLLVGTPVATKVFAAHRLDCETSGVLFLTKTEDAAGEMGLQFRSRMVGKKYIAIVDGDVSKTLATAHAFPEGDIKCLRATLRAAPEPSSPALKFKRLKVDPESLNTSALLGTVTAPICGRYEDRPKQMVDYTAGKESQTEMEVLYVTAIPADSIVGEAEKEGAGASGSDSGVGSAGRIVSCVSLTPVSGRTHQLRLHMAHIGHPILGDTLYASPEVISLSSRLELHSHRLQCRHPKKTLDHERELDLVAPLTLSDKFLGPLVKDC